MAPVQTVEHKARDFTEVIENDDDQISTVRDSKKFFEEIKNKKLKENKKKLTKKVNGNGKHMKLQSIASTELDSHRPPISSRRGGSIYEGNLSQRSVGLKVIKKP